MSCMIDLAMIESRHPQQGACFNRHVISAARIEPARYLECPSSSRPSSSTANIGSIARVIAGDDDSRNNRTDRNFGVEFARKGCRIPLQS